MENKNNVIQSTRVGFRGMTFNDKNLSITKIIHAFLVIIILYFMLILTVIKKEKSIILLKMTPYLRLPNQ